MADGDNLRLGRRNTSSAETRITRSGATSVSAFTVSNNGAGTGVFGISKANAVFGRSTSPNDSGVYGENTGGGYGAAGRTSGPQPAVWGDNTGNGHGVFGTTPSPEHGGVYGHNHAGGYGVIGRTGGPVPAVFGDNTGNGVGVRGQSLGTGVFAQGRWGMHAQGGDLGILATGARYGIQVESSGAAAERTSIGIYSRALGPATHLFDGMGVLGEGNYCGVYGVGRIGVYGAIHEVDPESPTPPPPMWAGHFEGPVRISGGLTVTGGKSAVVPHPDGSHRTLYTIESPESWFEDFGRAQLSQGHARVDLDGDFAVLVRTDDYHVFLTPEGDSNGLYVSGKREDGFEVREQQGGTSNVAFSYRVVAKRKDIEAERLQQAEAPLRPEDLPHSRVSEVLEPPQPPHPED
jgi:hypothetical protein